MKNNATDKEKNAVLGGVLYLVATPIGNLADLSERAVKVLSEVDFIAAEDTRVTLKLLSYINVQKELVSYYEHNKYERGPEIVSRLLSGQSCALTTDAGTPAISDPGEDLVRLCYASEIPVTVIPGPCAAVSALALSGLATSRFVFEGFLPSDKRERCDRIGELINEERTVIIYEAPHRLRKTLEELSDILGNRKISLCRELTKLNEEILTTDLVSASAIYTEKEPRGEYVLVIEGGSSAAASRNSALCALSPAEHVNHYLMMGYTKMDAIKSAARDRGVAKSEIYNAVNK